MKIGRPKGSENPFYAINDDDFRELFRYINRNKKRNMHRNLAAITLSYWLGIKISELVTLRLVDVFAKNAQVLSKIIVGVGDRQRTVYIDEVIQEFLLECTKEAARNSKKISSKYGHIFASQKGKNSSTHLNRIINKIMLDSNIEGATSKSLRYGYIMRLYKKNTPIKTIARLIGEPRLDRLEQRIKDIENNSSSPFNETTL